MKTNAKDYDRIEKAISYLEKHFLEQPQLDLLAQSAQLSPFHFQRLFKKWAGVTPKQFMGYLTAQHAKEKLAQSRSVLETAYDSGLSGPGRLHDLMVSVEAMTPGEYKTGGQGLHIEWGIHDTPFGLAFIALTARGICALAFLEKQNSKAVLKEYRSVWPKAEWAENKKRTDQVIQTIFGNGKNRKVKVLLDGTDFQMKVWEALLKIPAGSVQSYQDVAQVIRKPKATRAVGTAVGQNAISYLIPCHRVIRESGVLGNYRWGSARKKAMLGWEEAKVETSH
jgi:AraC family transcriptional regulator, regulatory protein of adaptative response / methylated-DNA-[protein]-cysteine methyltransferase